MFRVVHHACTRDLGSSTLQYCTTLKGFETTCTCFAISIYTLQKVHFASQVGKMSRRTMHWYQWCGLTFSPLFAKCIFGSVIAKHVHVRDKWPQIPLKFTKLRESVSFNLHTIVKKMSCVSFDFFEFSKFFVGPTMYYYVLPVVGMSIK